MVRLYWPVELRPAFDALFDIDEAMADVVARSTEPTLAAIKLAWWRERLEELRTGDGRPLPVHLKAQIIRELDRLELVLAQLKTVAAERDILLKTASDEMPSPPAMLVQLKGIGPETAAVLWSEGLFRRFDNRRQVAAYAGLAPTPWQSGSIDHEQGVCKAGNPGLRGPLSHNTR